MSNAQVITCKYEQLDALLDGVRLCSEGYVHRLQVIREAADAAYDEGAIAEYQWRALVSRSAKLQDSIMEGLTQAHMNLETAKRELAREEAGYVSLTRKKAESRLRYFENANGFRVEMMAQFDEEERPTGWVVYYTDPSIKPIGLQRTSAEHVFAPIPHQARFMQAADCFNNLVTALL